jgi:hypothetical protein
MAARGQECDDDPEITVKALAAGMIRARATANAYLISAIGTAETAASFSSTPKREPQ